VTQTFEEFLAETTPAEDRDTRKEGEKDPTKIAQRKPPSRGLCRRCGLNKPINRLMLCYPCWVKAELEKSGWQEGTPHPDWCSCEGLKDHSRLSDGN
jgi:hypothetical protein